MNHFFSSQKIPPIPAAFFNMQLLALLRVLAFLVCDSAACLASGLAGCLALAATTILSAVAKIASLNGLDMFHSFSPISNSIGIV